MPFITPRTLPPDRYCRRLFIPNSPEWIGTITGALLPLIYPSEWEQINGITAEEAASAAFDMLVQFWNDNCEGAGMFDIRLNPEDSCEVQKTVNGGQTWETAFRLDDCVGETVKARIRRNPSDGSFGYMEDEDIGFFRFPDGAWVDGVPLTFPEPKERTTGTDDQKRCDAAYAAARVLQALYQQTWGVFIEWAVKGAFNIAREFADLAADLLGGLGGTDVMIGIAEALHAEQTSFVEGGFPDSLIEEVQNILYCRASVDAEGRVTFDFDGVVSDFGAMGTDPYGGLNFLLQLFIGEDGLNAAGNIDAGAGDCAQAECQGWCYTWDFTTGDGGWSAEAGLGQYVSGQYWTTVDTAEGTTEVRRMLIFKTFPSRLHITRIEATWEYQLGQVAAGSHAFLQNVGLRRYSPNVSYNAWLVAEPNLAVDADGGGWDVDFEADDIFINLTPHFANTNNWQGVGRLLSVTLYGDAPINPFGEDNC